MPASDTFIAFWKGMTKRVGLKLTDKLLIGNIDTEKPQHIDVQDLPFARQSDLEAEASARASADTGIRNAADIYNVTQKVPLQSGYYTHATARAAVPAAIRKKGLIITYQTDASSWRTEQFFQGELAAWTTDANWKLTGMDFSGDITAINNQISVLKKTAFKRLAADTNLDTVLTPGAYYIGTQEIPDGEQGPALYSKDFLFVNWEVKIQTVPTHPEIDGAQYWIKRDGLSVRKHYGSYEPADSDSLIDAHWGEWTALVEDAPYDDKLYARKNRAWVDANDARIVTVSEAEYADLEEKDPDTLYFIV
jgi:hypothetical protein